MKNKLLIFSLAMLAYSATNAQEEVIKTDEYNKWSFEINAGQSKGIKPYSDGYYSSNPNSVLGKFQFNHYDFGIRYMFSPKLGLKFDAAFDKLEPTSGNGSEPFELQQIRIGLQAVVNGPRLLDVQSQLGRFGFLFHGGFQAANMNPKIGPLVGHDEYNIGFMFGLTPEFRISKNFALNADVTLLSNLRQHYNWDGTKYSDASNNLSGSMISTSLGLSFSFGNQKIHGDWAVFEDRNKQELEALEKRIGDIETNLTDSDKDGVPDYLDVETNSIAGVAVDSKGRMIDLNQNGVPDELERYMEKTITSNNTTASAAAEKEVVRRLINEGYITVYFDTNRIDPTKSSNESLGFVLTYLRNNPSASVDIIGNADEIGDNNYNDKLALNRARRVQEILIKSGISASRLNIISQGEDNSVDPTSASARQLVRRVLFKIK